MVTLCDEDGVFQVGQQRVLVVTLVSEKHQEPGEGEGTPELGLTAQVGQPHPRAQAGWQNPRRQRGRLRKGRNVNLTNSTIFGASSTGWAVGVFDTVSVKFLRGVAYTRFLQRATC